MAASDTFEIDKPKLVIGEGKEEVAFFSALLRHLKLEDIKIGEYGGKGELGGFIRKLTKFSGFNDLVSLGVTCDADNSFERTFQSVQSALRNASLSVPDRPLEMAGEKPQIYIFVLPDNESPGMLEDLCLRSVQNDRGMKCVDDFMKCVVDHAKREPSPDAKARVHAWLASQDRPDLQLGVAAESGIWPLGGEAFTRIGDFLRSL